jgi:hypothetical protein
MSTSMRTRLKPVLSWIAVTLGCLAGFIACAEFGVGGVALSDRSPAWYLPWFGITGEALLGVGFLVGSLVALRNRRLAGIIFLAVMPVAAFCLAYPASGFLVSRADGGWFETPFPGTAIELGALFYAPFLPPLWMWRRTKRAVIVFAVAAFVAGVIFARSRWAPALLPRLAGWSIPLLLPGLFWLRTGKLGWPSLLQTRPSSLAKRVVALAATCVAILCLDVVFTVMLCGLGSNLFSPNCKGRPLFIHPLFPTQAVFTAKVFFAARSIDALLGLHGGLHPSGPDHGVGDWAIGTVQERFWGMPYWTRLVLLTNDVYWEGETYFVDGRRFSGLLTQFLPIIGDIACGRTKLAQNAIVDLRLLRKPPPIGSLRIIGYVRGPEKLAFGWTRPPKPNVVAGARISVTGPAGSSIVETDSAGVYELNDLALGDYTLRLLTPENQLVGFFDSDGSTATLHLDHSGIVEKNFELFWNGRIEGQVKDDVGKPAHAWVELLSADGSQIPGNVNFFQMAAKDGSYQFRKIPPGRYLVVVNPSGPYDDWPYDLQYYPAGVRKNKARVLELARGQRVEEINFRAPLLRERDTDVRVKWANGTVAAGAHVCVAYENTDDYEALDGRNCIRDTDQNGLAVIHFYGRSQVRVFAEQYQPWPDRFRSQPVQSAADQTPNTINLVLTSAKR